MVELGTRCTTERVQIGNSPPTVARAAFLSRQPHAAFDVAGAGNVAMVNCDPIPQSKERNWKPSTYSKRACPRPSLHGGRRVTGVPPVAAARMRHERTASWRSVGCHREIWTPPAQFSGWPSRITQTHWRWCEVIAPRPGG